jgi:uncharacterized protein YhjY with autotransporter beta-barrel domain
VRTQLNRTLPLMAAVIAAGPALSAPAGAQTGAAVAPLLTLPGETPLQQAAGDAVLKMCGFFNTNFGLAGLDRLTLAQQDLYGQCHSLKAASGNSANNPALLGALQQISGNEVTAQGALATVAGQFANISGRLSALRFGSFSAPGGGGLSDNEAGDGDTLVAENSEGDQSAPAGSMGRAAMIDTAFVSDSPLQVAQAGAAGSGTSAGGAGSSSVRGPESPWGLFVEGSYNSGHHDATVNEDPFHFHASSLTAGLDYNFGSAVLGASVGYDDYDAQFRPLGALVSGGSAQVQGTSGSLYGAWFGQNWTFNGIATAGKLSSDLGRVVSYTIPNPAGGPFCAPVPATTCAVNQQFIANPDGRYLAIGASVGYDYSAHAWNLAPSLSLSYRQASIDHFAETADSAGAGSGLALAFNDQAIDSLRSIAGIDLSRSFSENFGVLTPTVRVEWDHEFRNGPRTIQAHYANDPSPTCVSCFSIATDPAPSNYGVAAAGVTVLLARRLQAYVYYEELFAAANYSSNTIAIGVRGQF